MPTMIQVTFSGAGVEPRRLRGSSVVSEDDCVTLDGDVVARWNGYAYDIEGTHYERFAVGYVDAWPDVEV